MARQTQQLNYTSFTNGIITEASPLTFPDGASIDENNFELTKQGFRRRRLGLETVSNEYKLENGAGAPKDIVTYLWDNNSTTGQEFLVVAIKNEILIYDVTTSIPGDNLVYQTTVQGNRRLSLTSHAGQLIVANGEKNLTIIRALGNNLFSEREDRLKIRDRVGMPDYARANNEPRQTSLLNAARANYRPTNNELYLDPPYPVNGSVGTAAPPSTITYSFGKKRDVSNDGVTIHQLTTNIEPAIPEFQGYPIDTFVLRDDGVVKSLSIIFKEGFYRKTIEAIGQANDFQLVDGGITYTATLTTGEYNSYLALSKNLRIREANADNHPHIYNLWNQGWADLRMNSAGFTNLLDPVSVFVDRNGGVHGANADNINSVLYPNSEHASNRTADRFHEKDLFANPGGSSVAPQGHYIIDALDRGESRNEVYFEARSNRIPYRVADTEMNFEYTTGGATTVTEYAGRVWYAGFSGDSVGSTIPMSSKILYGQIDDDNILSCYQEADPTSKEDADLIDTDGGWVSIDGIDEIVRLIATDTALIVFATNGIWVVSGIDGNTFTPTSSLVSKITDKGVVNVQSIVQVDTDIFFWTRDGLYQLAAEGFASFKLNPLTKNTVNEIILGLDEASLVGMSGAYDERTERLIWIIDGAEGATERRELVFHLSFGSFTINTFYKENSETQSKEVVSIVRTPQFTSSDSVDNVIAGVDNVVAGGGIGPGIFNVVVESTTLSGKPTRTTYLSIREDDTGSYVSFANKVRLDFKDWGVVDAPAFMLTGYVTGGDTAREKQVPYLTVHCNRTETFATLDGVENESSCLVQSQWEWTNDAFAGKWGPQFQAYRLERPQIRGVGQPVAEGIQVVTTKNKLRGRGKTVSLLFSTEPDKDCQVLGWSMIAGVNRNV